MSARDEEEIAHMPPEEQAEYLEMLGLDEPSIPRFVHAAFDALDLISMFTLGPVECRAWPIPNGTLAEQAAGRIHTDMERGFIRVEIVPWNELVAHGSEARCKEAGVLRVEGKTYRIEDGDCAHFLFNV
jgi:ribosome-binding ATPase YchF (GTP1/OBG family)